MEGHFADHAVFLDKFITQLFYQVTLPEHVQKGFVVFGESRYIEQSGSSYFPAFLIDLGLFIVLFILLVWSLYLHGLTGIAHHAFHVEIKQNNDKAIEGTILVLQDIFHFFVEGFDDER